MITLESPTKLVIDVPSDKLGRLKSALTFRSKKAQFDLQRFRNGYAGRAFLTKYGDEAWREKIQEMQDAVKVCLLKTDEVGIHYTHPGLIPHVQQVLGTQAVKSTVVYPPARAIPWDRAPEFKTREYQETAVQKLLEGRHAAVEIGTGLGKSHIAALLLKRLGLNAVVMAPTTNIANQLFREFTTRFGKKYVGMWGDGKKHLGKRITVGIAAGLSLVKPGTDAWDHLSKAQIFIADESHMCPAETLARVCLGLCANSPYRFFFSGTQTRNDGAELLLQGITGPIVYEMTVAEGVDQGFLSKPHFFMHYLESADRFRNRDVIEMTRAHFLYNPAVNAKAAQIANMSVKSLQHQVLILVDEVEQITHLLPHLRFEFGFAHAPLTADQKKKLPEMYHKSDPDELVARFNREELSILIGTSCINTGTDIRPVKTMINLQAGKSPIKFPQSVGRGTRRPPGKTWFNYHDFAVKIRGLSISEDPAMRQAFGRAALYKSIYPTVQWVDMPFTPEDGEVGEDDEA